ncbi:MAG: AAA family ATPase [Alphaproteobacteria bacterium]|nr:AAA family ATPase [Alphaproteobacteria bacterium]
MIQGTSAVAIEEDIEEEPSSASHHRILALSVTGGFLDGLRLDFEDGLNCIIGGRGTGKTTVLEFIRFLLSSDDPQERSKANKEVVDENLRSGKVVLDIETQGGVPYRIERSIGEAAALFNARGEPQAASLNRSRLFKADIYGQNKIEEIARNARFQLQLIDRFAETEIRQTQEEIERTKHGLRQKIDENERNENALRECEHAVAELEGINLKLEESKPSGSPEADALALAEKAKSLRSREGASIQTLRDAVKNVEVQAGQWKQHVVGKCHNVIDEFMLRGENGAFLSEIQKEISAFLQSFETLEHQAAALSQETDNALLGIAQRLAQVHALQDQAYRDLAARVQQQSTQVRERQGLQRRQNELLAQEKERIQRLETRKNLAQDISDFSCRLSDLRDKRYEARRTVATELSTKLAPTIRVSVTQAEDKSLYETELRDMLKGSGVRYNTIIPRIVTSVCPGDLARFVRTGDVDALERQAETGKDQAQKIISHIQQHVDNIAKLETMEIDDLPRIELKDGAEYKNSAQLSTGQRCTVILPILLLQDARPLLIDQPEDNLDNAFVYDTVVRSVREAKGSRQLIFVTHNPNIPVLGDAERVFVLSSDGQQAKLGNSGNVDAVKDKIEYLLEGGADAFRERMKRYGH